MLTITCLAVGSETTESEPSDGQISDTTKPDNSSEETSSEGNASKEESSQENSSKEESSQNSKAESKTESKVESKTESVVESSQEEKATESSYSYVKDESYSSYTGSRVLKNPNIVEDDGDDDEDKKVEEKNIKDWSYVARRWIFLPIIFTLLSIGGLIGFNVYANKQNGTNKSSKREEKTTDRSRRNFDRSKH